MDPDDRTAYEVGPNPDEIRIVDAQFGQSSGAFAFEQNPSIGHQSFECNPTFGILKIEHDATFRGVVVPPVEAVFGPRLVIEKRTEVAKRAASRRFDHDHVGAHVGQQLAGECGCL